MIRMLKVLFTILILQSSAIAQQDIIILVDISKSNKAVELEKAKQLVEDLVLGKGVNDSGFKSIIDPKSKLRLDQPLTSKGNTVLILPFGDRDRVYETPRSMLVENYPSDLVAFIDREFPTRPRDSRTYVTLAIARAAELAKQKNLSEYLLLMVSDNVNDDMGNGTSSGYTSYQQELVDNFATPSNPVHHVKEGVIRSNLRRDFSVTITSYMIENWKAPPYNVPPDTATNDSVPNQVIPAKVCELAFTSYAGGGKGKEKEVPNGDLTMRWTCSECDENTRYSIAFKSTDQNKENNVTKTVAGSSFKTELNPGSYRVSVSANGSGCKSSITYIKVPGGGGAGLIVVLLIIAAGAAGFWYWNKKRGARGQDSVNHSAPPPPQESTSESDIMDF